ncbi:MULTISPECIES: ABC transporter permease [unclassified Cytobacillus]|uniref:ABC transporter permease n=1 Tax=unclassified Cytobacillus TaxID=2675268 RepID=UPI00135A9EA4|nr:ABC transporter permease [Cytobacillus sp. AMY 15.2]KAF0821116.1 Efflux ABC transporter, permease protein [Bacillus sp. ZZV12-4809]MCM3091064.1 ABC transporter permease [Cytobacillus sp. AMY 15.2]
MLSILKSEWFKLRKSSIIGILLAGPLIGLGAGIGADTSSAAGVMNEWYMLLIYMNLPYGVLFLPLMTGVLASLVCRYEHQAGGWKQLLALPVTRGKVFAAKYVLIILLVLFIQLCYLAAIAGAGFYKGVADPFPAAIVWKSILGGWVAAFPLVALQLWMSVWFKSFAAPFAVNVIFTLPSILAMNSEKVGPYYPWAQPFAMMYPASDSNDIFFIPWEQLMTVIGGFFLLFYLGGYFYFQRKAV